MNICYYTSELKFKRKSCELSRNMHNWVFDNIFSGLSQPEINNIMNMIFIEFCGATIYGYNTDKNSYWVKRVVNNNCKLMFTITFTKDEITIVHLIGSNNDINELYSNLKEGFEIYKISPFLFE